MEVVWGTSARLNVFYRDWCALRVFRGQAAEFDNAFKCFGVHDSGKLIAVVVYHNWDKDAGVIEISGAADDRRWLTRPVIRQMYNYAFKDLGCQMIVQRIPDRLQHMKRIFRVMGYGMHYIPRLAGRNEGVWIGTFTAEAWATHKLNATSLDVSPAGSDFALILEAALD